MKYVGVIVDISHEQLDKSFTYSVPERLENKVKIGSCVDIPFGKMKRTGYVVEEITKPEGNFTIKDILDIREDGVGTGEKLIKLAYWMKTRYGGTIYKSLSTVIPIKKKVKQKVRKTVKLLVSQDEAQLLAFNFAQKGHTAKARLLLALCESPVTELSLITTKLNISISTVNSLEQNNIIEIESESVFRNTMNISSKTLKKTELTLEQKSISEEICRDIDNKDTKTCLIKGITGSGKTEVYMDIIDHVLKSGKEVIMLIPEIALTFQTVMRFYEHFGDDRISIINSRLSDGEKYDRFLMAEQGKIKIMIGPRSALFTPFNNLGLIIIDEEQENAYRSENMPRYDAVETAIALAGIHGAKVILGSATPRIESYYRAKKGLYKLYTLNKRPGGAVLPQCEIIDLRAELKKGNKSPFSNRLFDLIEDRLEKKEQVMLFINRRGYQGFINCRDCGEVVKCPHCDVSLTLHKNGNLLCHYCGYEEKFVKRCKKCNSSRIGTFKAGTEFICEEAERCFPLARILRMDADTTKGKNGHEEVLSKFANNEADILVGTQMIVKGHDFSNVTLVGIILADATLHMSDFEAGERSFDLLTQAAGRAGRAEKPGTVIIQTYDPDNFCIKAAAKQDYDAFYEEEIGFRSLMMYPPTVSMLSVRVACADESKAVSASCDIKKMIKDEEVNAIGPANATIYKINDVFFRMIYFKSSKLEKLIEVKDIIEKYALSDEDINKNIQIQFEFR